MLVYLWLSALASSPLEKETTSAGGPGRQPAHQPEAGAGVSFCLWAKNLGVVGIGAGFDLLSICLLIGHRHIRVLCGYDNSPVAHARVLVAAAIMDRLVREIRYYR